MMSTPYCSSPIEKLMVSTRPEEPGPSAVERPLSWLDELVEFVWSAVQCSRCFAHQ
jgi:hypothetical protein